MLAREADSAAHGRDFGSNMPDLLASYDQSTFSWKTSQHCLVEGLTPFSGPWPRSGMMQNGIAYPLPTLAQTTDEIGSGLWPTPRANQHSEGPFPSELDGSHGWGLGSAVADAAASAPARMWPTPTVQDPANNAGPSQFERNSLPLNAAAGGALNPRWVEWLMGYPDEWTALED